jgi:hypothetical protein
MVNSRPAHDELRAGYCQKQPAYCSPAPDLVTRLPRRSGASTFLGISVCISAAPAPLDRYLAASPAMSLIPFAPFSFSAFSFRKPPQQLDRSTPQLPRHVSAVFYVLNVPMSACQFFNNIPTPRFQLSDFLLSTS